MPQTLNVSVPINIPENLVLVEKADYENLNSQLLIGKRWNMEDLRNHLGKKSAPWIKDNILYQPMFRDDFAKMERNGDMHKAIGKGDAWWFHATVFSQWLEDNWNRIDWSAKL